MQHSSKMHVWYFQQNNIGIQATNNTIEMIKIEDNPKNEKEELKSVEIDNSKKDN